MKYPIIFENMSFSDYLADPADSPSASSSILRSLTETAPAKVRLQSPRLNPEYQERHSTEFDIGTAAHGASGWRRQ